MGRWAVLLTVGALVCAVRRAEGSPVAPAVEGVVGEGKCERVSRHDALLHLVNMAQVSEEGGSERSVAAGHKQCNSPLSRVLRSIAGKLSHVLDDVPALRTVGNFVQARPELAKGLVGWRDEVVHSVMTASRHHVQDQVLLQFLDDSSLNGARACPLMNGVLGFVSLNLFVGFVYQNRWFFLSYLPNEVSRDSLQKTKLGMWALASAVVFAVTSSVCFGRGLDDCETRRLASTLGLFPSFVALLWGMIESASNTEQQRMEEEKRSEWETLHPTVHGDSLSVDVQQPYVWSLKTSHTHESELASGSEGRGSSSSLSSFADAEHREYRAKVAATQLLARRKDAYLTVPQILSAFLGGSAKVWIGAMGIIASLLVGSAAC